MKDEHVVFGSTERGVFSLHVSETGKTIAKLGRPKER
jgi:CRISPR/Cas system CMR-associated protein Cmr1 (group 7 of RAMP superfamily)